MNRPTEFTRFLPTPAPRSAPGSLPTFSAITILRSRLPPPPASSKRSINERCGIEPSGIGYVDPAYGLHAERASAAAKPSLCAHRPGCGLSERNRFAVWLVG